jgi:hypothetical protein
MIAKIFLRLLKNRAVLLAAQIPLQDADCVENAGESRLDVAIRSIERLRGRTKK